MTDDELLHELRSRNPAALEALADAYTLPVYALVHRVLAGAGTAQDVEECTGDVLYLAWERADRFDPGRGPLRTWLLMLAKYQALEVRRRLLRQTGGEVAMSDTDLAPDPQDQPETALAAREERAAVQQALDQLPPVEKELVYRRYFLGERVDAIAGALGLTRQAADNRLWRARKTLKGLLGWWQKGEVAGDER